MTLQTSRSDSGVSTYRKSRREHFKIWFDEWERYVNPKTKLAYDNQVENVNCPVCNSSDHEQLFLKKGFRFVRCGACQHIFINPQLKLEVIEEYFKTSKAWAEWPKRVLSQKEQLEFDEKKYKKYIEIVKKFFKPQQKLIALDVGSSAGVFLNLVKKEGWVGCGIELSKTACDYSVKEFQLEVTNTTLLQYQTTQKFDLITFWASLEYHKNISEIIEKAESLLSPNGLILIFVSGNSHSLAMRTLREKCVGFIFNRYHSFNPESLDFLMKRFRFSCVHRSSMIPETDIILNALNYDDPYDPQHPKIAISDSDRSNFENFILSNNMGYKLMSIYRRIA